MFLVAAEPGSGADLQKGKGKMSYYRQVWVDSRGLVHLTRAARDAANVGYK